MLFRRANIQDRQAFDRVAGHPLQSWAWGEFREKTGVAVERLVGVDDKKIISVAVQITFHRLPFLPFTVGYCPRGPEPTKEMLLALRELGKKHTALFIKLEPNVDGPVDNEQLPMNGRLQKLRDFLKINGCVRGRSLFTDYSFQIDLTQSEEELLKKMKSKTRYNLRLAERKGVVVAVDNSREAFIKHLRLTEETTKRQGFYAHTKNYHQKMWETLRKSDMAYLLQAVHQGKVIVSWIVFVFNNVLYYPYGASSSEDRQVMASNLMMWEVMKFGKAKGVKLFDLWGSLGPKPDVKDPWYGFHRFKEGYGGVLMEFVGSFDLVLKSQIYWIYRLAETIRWFGLRMLAPLRR